MHSRWSKKGRREVRAAVTIVGTNPTRFPSARRALENARTSATSVSTFMSGLQARTGLGV